MTTSSNDKVEQFVLQIGRALGYMKPSGTIKRQDANAFMMTHDNGHKEISIYVGKEPYPKGEPTAKPVVYVASYAHGPGQRAWAAMGGKVGQMKRVGYDNQMIYEPDRMDAFAPAILETIARHFGVPSNALSDAYQQVVRQESPLPGQKGTSGVAAPAVNM